MESDTDEDNAVWHGAEGREPHPEDGNGSTETIPSLWEPSSALDLDSPVETGCPSTSTPRLPTELIRSQSMELCRPVPHGVLTASRSDPTLPIESRRRHSSGGETYAHRHIRLSMHRLPTAPVVSPGML